MRVGVLGTGDVGRTLARAFVTLGHEVRMGSRTPDNPTARTWAESVGARGSSGSFAEAAAFGELDVLAVKGSAAEEALAMAGPENFRGKLVIDTTNPLDFSSQPPTLFVGTTDSLGERVQRALPGARVVKCFNIVGHGLMFRPQLAGGPPDMFIAGDDDGARNEVATLLREHFGWGVVDLGGIASARWLEPMCMAWVIDGFRSGHWTHAFRMLRG